MVEKILGGGVTMSKQEDECSCRCNCEGQSYGYYMGNIDGHAFIAYPYQSIF